MTDEQKRDRVLGDEWKNWDGTNETSFNEKKRTFFIFLFFMITLTVSFSMFVLYMIAPRLKSFGETFFVLLSCVVAALTFLFVLWYLLLFLAVATEKRIFFARRLNTKILAYIVDKTSSLGVRFGISKDRMANSFLKVFNIITRKEIKKALKPLIILPRCLVKEAKDKASVIASKYGIEYFVVGGGEAALAKVREKKPEAIIGVACERDLLNGIKEVSSSIPVIGIPNKRPMGPCKETEIDLDELERAVRYFLQV